MLWATGTLIKFCPTMDLLLLFTVSFHFSSFKQYFYVSRSQPLTEHNLTFQSRKIYFTHREFEVLRTPTNLLLVIIQPCKF